MVSYLETLQLLVRPHENLRRVNNQPNPRFDFALSFAGEERGIARQIYRALSKEGYSVFIDEDYQHEVIGEDGMTYLTEIYARDSRFCVVLLSEAYDQGTWTHLEREAIRSRELLGERGVLIPVKVGPYQPTWLPPSRIYFDLTLRPLPDLLKILRAKRAAASSALITHLSTSELTSMDVAGNWSSTESVSSRIGRTGTVTLSQSGISINGTAHLVERHPDGSSLQYSLSLHGELVPAHRLVRFVGTMIEPHRLESSRPYSVDSFSLTLSDTGMLVGTCVDERGLQGDVTMVRIRK